MHDLIDEQRTMHLAEQYSDRRMMVKLSRVRNTFVHRVVFPSLAFSIHHPS